MKMHSVIALALGLVAMPAAAQTAAPEAAAATVNAADIKPGAMVFSAEGRRVGKIDRVRGDAVAVITAMKMIYIPIATLRTGERGLVSSLSNKEINRL
jgi:hypothetical protein